MIPAIYKYIIYSLFLIAPAYGWSQDYCHMFEASIKECNTNDSLRKIIWTKYRKHYNAKKSFIDFAPEYVNSEYVHGHFEDKSIPMKITYLDSLCPGNNMLHYAKSPIRLYFQEPRENIISAYINYEPGKWEKYQGVIYNMGQYWIISFYFDENKEKIVKIKLGQTAVMN